MGKRNTTIHLPHLYLKLIDEIICEKDIPCASEFIRIAIRKLLKRDMVLLFNPRIEQMSDEVKEFLTKQKAAGLQKSLDQYRASLNQNLGLHKNQPPAKSEKNKQARIESFWK